MSAYQLPISWRSSEVIYLELAQVPGTNMSVFAAVHGDCREAVVMVSMSQKNGGEFISRVAHHFGMRVKRVAVDRSPVWRTATVCNAALRHKLVMLYFSPQSLRFELTVKLFHLIFEDCSFGSETSLAESDRLIESTTMKYNSSLPHEYEWRSGAELLHGLRHGEQDQGSPSR